MVQRNAKIIVVGGRKLRLGIPAAARSHVCEFDLRVSARPLGEIDADVMALRAILRLGACCAPLSTTTLQARPWFIISRGA